MTCTVFFVPFFFGGGGAPQYDKYTPNPILCIKGPTAVF